MATREWMSPMAENHRRYGFQTNWNAQLANRVSIRDIEKGISDFTALVHHLFVGQIPTTKVSGNCSIPGHPENACPSLQHNLIWETNAVRGFPSYDFYSESYNPGFYRNKGKPATHRESNLSTSHENGDIRNSSIPRVAITNRNTSSGEREYDDTPGMSKLQEDEKEILNTSLKVKINTPVLELKALAYHLQCLYLGVSEILSNIIFQELVKEQYELKLNEKEVLRSSKEKTQGFTDIILKKLFEVGKKVLFYKFRLKLIQGKLGSSWLGHFESVNIFSHGVARLKSLDMRQIVKVNGHRLKSFLGGGGVTTIIGIVLASLQQLTH
ncbi:UNVERIFIED_CONTAM: hypothetical protein Sradi_6190400 [Sesamum radiatum]|uniref:Uncharacterized protein n=1 Tax=Sesamum radiatum TaxID=300843 RepID=A0AAW2KA08_SESRA